MAEFQPGFRITSSRGGRVGPFGVPALAIEHLAVDSSRTFEEPEAARQFRDVAGTTRHATPADFARFRAGREALFTGLIR